MKIEKENIETDGETITEIRPQRLREEDQDKRKLKRNVRLRKYDMRALNLYKRLNQNDFALAYASGKKSNVLKETFKRAGVLNFCDQNNFEFFFGIS